MSSKKTPIALIVFGSLLALGPLWGTVITVIGMIHAFVALDATGPARQEALAANVSLALWATMAGMIASPIGVALLAGGIVWLVRSRPARPISPKAGP